MKPKIEFKDLVKEMVLHDLKIFIVFIKRKIFRNF